MYVDLRLARIEAEYRREKLSRAYQAKDRRQDATKTVLDGRPVWPSLVARLLLLDR